MSRGQAKTGTTFKALLIRAREHLLQQENIFYSKRTYSTAREHIYILTGENGDNIQGLVHYCRSSLGLSVDPAAVGGAVMHGGGGSADGHEEVFLDIDIVGPALRGGAVGRSDANVCGPNTSGGCFVRLEGNEPGLLAFAVTAGLLCFRETVVANAICGLFADI